MKSEAASQKLEIARAWLANTEAKASSDERLVLLRWRAGQYASDRDSHYIGTEDVARALLDEPDATAPHFVFLRAWAITLLNELATKGG